MLLGYETPSERYILKTSAGQILISAEVLLAKLDNNLKVQLEGLTDFLSKLRVIWQDQGDKFWKCNFGEHRSDFMVF